MDLVSVLVSVADSRASEPLPHMRSVRVGGEGRNRPTLACNLLQNIEFC